MAPRCESFKLGSDLGRPLLHPDVVQSALSGVPAEKEIPGGFLTSSCSYGKKKNFVVVVGDENLGGAIYVHDGLNVTAGPVQIQSRIISRIE